MVATNFNMTPIEGRVGIALEVVDGTGIAEPTIELFIQHGSNPDLHKQEDSKITYRAFNEPIARDEAVNSWHSEGDLPGIKFAPGNGLPEFLSVAFGNDWYSSVVTKLALETGGGAVFSRGDKVFGKTSKAKGEVAKIVGNNLYLTGCQGTFSTSEDLYDFPGGADYGKNAAASGVTTILTGYYVHKMQAVGYMANSGVVTINTTSGKGCIGDTMQDFRELGVSGYPKRVMLTVKDAADPKVPLSGWLSKPIMCCKYKSGSAAFTVGKKLSAKTGAGTPAVIGNVVAIVGVTATGTLFFEMDATARTILDGDTLSDDGSPAGAATTDQATIPAYLGNACEVWTSPDSDGTMDWNGDYATFDETDAMTYTAVQKKYDQKSMTVFVKNAGDKTMVSTGTHVKGLTFDIAQDKFTFDVSLIGRTIAYPTTEPAYQGGMSVKAPYGAYTRAFEIDGSSAGLAAVVNTAQFGATWTFNPNKAATINSNTPASLVPSEYAITGTLNVQFRDHSLLTAFWGDEDGATPIGGSRVRKTLLFDMDSGEDVITGYHHEFDMEVGGMVSNATLNRDDAGYICPVTISGIMQPDISGVEWSPARFYLYDATATHA
jgi:hypothetical protein